MSYIETPRNRQSLIAVSHFLLATGLHYVYLQVFEILFNAFEIRIIRQFILEIFTKTKELLETP